MDARPPPYPRSHLPGICRPGPALSTYSPPSPVCRSFVANAVKCNPPWNRAGLTVLRISKVLCCPNARLPLIIFAGWEADRDDQASLQPAAPRFAVGLADASLSPEYVSAQGEPAPPSAPEGFPGDLPEGGLFDATHPTSEASTLDVPEAAQAPQSASWSKLVFQSARNSRDWEVYLADDQQRRRCLSGLVTRRQPNRLPAPSAATGTTVLAMVGVASDTAEIELANNSAQVMTFVSYMGYLPLVECW